MRDMTRIDRKIARIRSQKAAGRIIYPLMAITVIAIILINLDSTLTISGHLGV